MDWVVEELLGADFGDIRLTERLMRVAEQLGGHPAWSLTEEM